MSSYKPLADHLATQKGDVWEASFAEIERALGRELPRSAYRHNAWWANQTGPGHSQTQGWRSVGWRTSKLDLERKRVRFEREKTEARGSSLANAGEIDEQLVERALALGEISDRAAVINIALAEFIRQKLARFVEDLGGSQPGFQAAPRERPWS